jgi:hypothetical protein
MNIEFCLLVLEQQGPHIELHGIADRQEILYLSLLNIQREMIVVKSVGDAVARWIGVRKRAVSENGLTYVYLRILSLPVAFGEFV